MAYSWPGNVRQLKNITENLSVTCGDRDITPDILREYLPERRSNQLVAVNSRSDNNRSFENEREILYQILFDLRRDVNELKKLVHEGHLHNESAAQKSGNAFTLLGHGFEKDTNTKEENSYCEAEEIDAAEESQTRSLEHTERELIRKTLSQTNGRRKVAAEKLGISERTLYRKIKEYGLE